MLVEASSLFLYNIFEKESKLSVIYDFQFNDYTWELLHIGIIKGNILKPESKTYRINKMDRFDTERRRYNTNKLEATAVEPVKHSDYALTHTYGWPNYWSLDESDMNNDLTSNENHLRSIREVFGYYVKSEDNQILGYIIDFIIDTDIKKIIKTIIRESKFLPFGKHSIFDVDELSFVSHKPEILHIQRK